MRRILSFLRPGRRASCPGSCTTNNTNQRRASQTLAGRRQVVVRTEVDAPARIPHAEKHRETAAFQPRRGRGPGRWQGQEDGPRHAARRRRGRHGRRDRAAQGLGSPFYDTTPHRHDPAVRTAGRIAVRSTPRSRCRRQARRCCAVPLCARGRSAGVDPDAIAMRAIVAEAAEADPELGGGRNGRRGKPSVTPHAAAARDGVIYLAQRLGIVAARGPRARARACLAAQRAPGARASRQGSRSNWRRCSRPIRRGRSAAAGFSRVL